MLTVSSRWWIMSIVLLFAGFAPQVHAGIHEGIVQEVKRKSVIVAGALLVFWAAYKLAQSSAALAKVGLGAGMAMTFLGIGVYTILFPEDCVKRCSGLCSALIRYATSQ